MRSTFFFIITRFALAALVCLPASCAPRQAAPSGSRLFTDELGRAVTVKAEVNRIISLAPSITETLYALGLGDRVVGVTSYCDYPPEAAQKEKVGDTLRPSIERIVALKPDLVIASTASQLEQFVRKLDEIGIPIYVSNPRNIEELLRSIEQVGELTNSQDQARKLASSLRARMDAIRLATADRPRPRVLLVLGINPLITAGGESFINDLITRAGGQSISGDEKSDYPQYSLETAVRSRPEVIFLQAGEDNLPDRLKQTPAALKGRVYRLDDDLLLRPGPRIIDGLEQMANRLQQTQ